MGSLPSETAIHEAGHCVQAMLDSVSCIVTKTRDGGWMRPTEEMNAESGIRMSVAGGIAEYISRDLPSMEGLMSKGDLECVAHRLDEAGQHKIGPLAAEVYENLNAHWPKVMRIASAIDYHDCLDERELWALFRHDEPRPLRFTEGGKRVVLFTVSRGE